MLAQKGRAKYPSGIFQPKNQTSKIMKKVLLAVVTMVIFLSSCEVEVRDGHNYHHPMGWEHRHHPDHHEVYNHGYHHDAHGGEIVIHN